MGSSLFGSSLYEIQDLELLTLPPNQTLRLVVLREGLDNTLNPRLFILGAGLFLFTL